MCLCGWRASSKTEEFSGIQERAARVKTFLMYKKIGAPCTCKMRSEKLCAENGSVEVAVDSTLDFQNTPTAEARFKSHVWDVFAPLTVMQISNAEGLLGKLRDGRACIKHAEGFCLFWRLPMQ